MRKKKTKIELLAPAGNLEKMKTALAFGADAVYAGIPEFSLRVRINDFDLRKIAIAAAYCHKLGKKIYVTINIFAHNPHIKILPDFIKKLKKIGVDAVIVSDPGVKALIKEIWPKAIIHLSTQANCTNWRAAAFWQAQGVQRIILGREVALPEIKTIYKKCPDLELEYFVHGAMCMAYSGRCFLSKYYAERSANLGDCIQPCRWQYEKALSVKKSGADAKNDSQTSADILEIVEEEHGSYILNSKDLCLVKHLRALAEAGVCSFKIEGRAKSVYYQAVAAGIYARAIDDLRLAKDETKYLYSELEDKLVHRGYTSGFLLGEKADQNLRHSHENSAWEFCGQVFLNKDFNGKKGLFIKVHNTIKLCDTIEIVCPKYDIIKLRVEKLWDIKTGNEIKEAHGGQGAEVFIALSENVPKYSVVRRKTTSNKQQLIINN